MFPGDSTGRKTDSYIHNRLRPYDHKCFKSFLTNLRPRQAEEQARCPPRSAWQAARSRQAKPGSPCARVSHHVPLGPQRPKPSKIYHLWLRANISSSCLLSTRIPRKGSDPLHAPTPLAKLRPWLSQGSPHDRCPAPAKPSSASCPGPSQRPLQHSSGDLQGTTQTNLLV